MDCESVDIYPVGWGELVGHKLEGPRQAAPLKKEKKKAVGKRGKKRAHGNGAVSPGSGLSQVNKVLSLLEACFDLISGSPLSMNIQIMSRKITENLGFKSLLRKVNFEYKNKHFQYVLCDF